MSVISIRRSLSKETKFKVVLKIRTLNKFDNENDFISFENDENKKNANHARHARHENLHKNLHTNYLFDDELLSRNFFDDMRDEYTL